MSDPATPVFATFRLDHPVRLGDKELIAAGTEIRVRKPDSGTMRGLSLMALTQLDVVALETLAPRITTPPIIKGAVMEASDLLQFGGEVLDFLLPKGAKEAVSPTA